MNKLVLIISFFLFICTDLKASPLQNSPVTQKIAQTNATSGASFTKPLTFKTNSSPSFSKNAGLIICYLNISAMLVIALLFAVNVKQLERKMRG